MQIHVYIFLDLNETVTNKQNQGKHLVSQHLFTVFNKHCAWLSDRTRDFDKLEQKSYDCFQYFNRVIALVPPYSVFYLPRCPLYTCTINFYIHHLWRHLGKPCLWRYNLNRAFCAASDQSLNFLSQISICRKHFSRFLHNLHTIY